jgi:tetratricopeptide (TPR) repeat protein
MKTSACLLAVALLASRPVFADAADRAALEEAKKLSKQANVQYQLGNFTEAADLYSRSYTLSPAPGLLFNLGQAQLMLKQYERAQFFFEGYLRDKPDAPNLALVQDLIAECKRDLAEEKAQRAKLEEERIAATRVIAPPPPQPPPKLPRRTLILRGTAMLSGMGGLTLVGISVALGLRSEIAKGLTALAPPGAQHDDFDSERRAYLVSAAVLGGIGAAALVGSGVLAYLGWRHSRAQVSLAPTLGGAILAGTF